MAALARLISVELRKAPGVSPEGELVTTNNVQSTFVTVLKGGVNILYFAGADRIDRFEVAEAFEVPLAFLMNPANHRRHVYPYEGGQRQFLSMPWQGVGADGRTREYFIWGATAAMLRNLYGFLSR